MQMILACQVDNYMDLERAVSELEKAAGMRLDKLTCLFLKGYTLKAPEPPKFDALERTASDA